MGYSYTMHLEAKIAEGVSVEKVAEALMPIIDYLGHDPATVFEGGALGEDEFLFNQETRDLWVSTYGEVGYSYCDLVVEAARNLDKIVSELGEIELVNLDANIDEAKSVFEFGPTKEYIESYVAKRDIEAGLRLMEPHLSAEKMDAIRKLLAGETACSNTGCSALKLVGEMSDIILHGVARVEIANAEGNPILSAWLEDAKNAVAKAKAIKN